MERSLARRVVMASLLGAGAVSMVPGCSADPDLPDGNQVTIAAKAPPPISGGTLQVTAGGLAVAADSDRDLVWLVDLQTKAVRKVALQEGDEPGRVALDASGRAHVALRGSGALATIDLAAGKVLARTPVCSAPRGVAFDAASDRLHVACAGGELVSVAPATGAITRKLLLDRDLRDVVVQGDRLLLTRFRAAEVVVVNADGSVLNRQAPPIAGGFAEGLGPAFTPTVAWRAVPLSSGGVAVVHQRSAESTVVISQPDGYGGSGDPCGGGSIVTSTVSTVDENGNPSQSASPAVVGLTVPVDLATDGQGLFAVASAGTDAVFFVSENDLQQGEFNCGFNTSVDTLGQPIAVASWNGRWIAQTREPAALTIMDMQALDGVSNRIELPGESVADSGHQLFHHAASDTTHLACASCHPEGSHDGHVWTFDIIGARRTQTVAGGVLDTTPLHWDGDLDDLGAIMHEVFERRMGGVPQGPRHISAFADWLQTIPAPVASPRADQAQIDRGKKLYFDAQVACASCHGGRHLTNNQTVDVGTTIGDGKAHAFQVPTLSGISHSGPYMHDGCAATLHDRFDPAKAACNGGDAHGKTSHLSASDIDDLVAYLETL